MKRSEIKCGDIDKNRLKLYIGNAGLNIIDMLNKSRGDIAYTLVDVESEVPAATVEKLEAIDGVLSVRTL